MRLPKKEINVFSVSAIDIFASAMGAFLLLTAVILPFYPNVSAEEARRRSDFMAAVMIIETDCVDLDLHVREEYGSVENYYYFNDKQPNGNTPGLSLDHLDGKGAEIWELEAIRPGASYVFGIDFYGRRQEGGCSDSSVDFAEAELRLYHNAGFSKLDNIVLRHGQDLEPLLEVITDNDAEFTVSPIVTELNGERLVFTGAERSRP